METINLSQGALDRLERIAKLRNWRKDITLEEKLERCIATTWLVVENRADEASKNIQTKK